MDPVVYNDAHLYITSCTKLEERIEKIDQIIDALLDMAIKAASTGNFSAYSLNDGQTQIRTEYRNTTDVNNAIKAFQDLRDTLEVNVNNKKTGRMIRLVDGSNFT